MIGTFQIMANLSHATEECFMVDITAVDDDSTRHSPVMTNEFLQTYDSPDKILRLDLTDVLPSKCEKTEWELCVRNAVSPYLGNVKLSELKPIIHVAHSALSDDRDKTELYICIYAVMIAILLGSNRLEMTLPILLTTREDEPRLGAHAAIQMIETSVRLATAVVTTNTNKWNNCTYSFK